MTTEYRCPACDSYHWTSNKPVAVVCGTTKHTPAEWGFCKDCAHAWELVAAVSVTTDQRNAA